jgi:hypothetical protein
VRVALRRPDRHPGRRGDLLERPVERVLQDDDLGLVAVDPGELGAELAPQLRVAGGANGIAVGGGPQVVDERLVGANALALGDVAARVHDEAMEPRGELRLAPELLQPHTELGERLLRRVARVLGVAEQVAGEPLDLRRVALAERLERARVGLTRIGSLSFS